MRAKATFTLWIKDGRLQTMTITYDEYRTDSTTVVPKVATVVTVLRFSRYGERFTLTAPPKDQTVDGGPAK